MVQILTHMREKLQFILRRNRVLTKDVSQLDSELGTKRDSLSKLRQRRDSLRQTATKIKETSVYINNPLLLNDMQVCTCSHEPVLNISPWRRFVVYCTVLIISDCNSKADRHALHFPDDWTELVVASPCTEDAFITEFTIPV